MILYLNFHRLILFCQDKCLLNFSPSKFTALAGHFRGLLPVFQQYLLVGGFPETAIQNDIRLSQRLLREDVVERVLKRDMTALFGVRNVNELEKLFIYLCIHSGGIVVEKDSAVYFSKKTRVFLKNHSNIAKPFGPEDSVYEWVKQRLLQKQPGKKIIQRSEEEEKRTIKIIARMQEELKGTNLEKALDFVSIGKLDKAMMVLSEYEEKEEMQIIKITKVRFAKAGVYELQLYYSNALKYYEKAVKLAPDNTTYLNYTGVMLNTLV